MGLYQKFKIIVIQCKVINVEFNVVCVVKFINVGTNIYLNKMLTSIYCFKIQF
jgi:hypothetical protein